MRIQTSVKAAVLGLVLLFGFGGPAQASVIVFEDVQFLGPGLDTFSSPFQITDAGSYEATLTDLGFPAVFDVLNLAITTSTEILGDVSAPGGQGMFTFDAEPGTYFVSVFGDASGPLDLGLFGAMVQSKPEVGVPTPLPGSVLLLSSGLIGFAWFRIRAKK